MMRAIVTDECIRDGQMDELKNPVALALNRQHPVLRAEWRTSLKYAWLDCDPNAKVRLPRNVEKFLRLFKDGHRRFRPLNFELPIDRTRWVQDLTAGRKNG